MNKIAAALVAGLIVAITSSAIVEAAEPDSSKRSANQAQEQPKHDPFDGSSIGGAGYELGGIPINIVAKASIYRIKLENFERFLNKLKPAEGGLEKRKTLEAFLANEELQVIEKLHLLLRRNKPTTSESITELIYFVGKDAKTGSDSFETRNIGVTFEVAVDAVEEEGFDAMTLALAIERVAFEPSEEAHYETEVGAYSQTPFFYTNRLVTTARARPGDLIFLGTMRPGGVPKRDSIDIVVLRVGQRTD